MMSCHCWHELMCRLELWNNTDFAINALFAFISGTIDGSHVSPTRVERVMEENKRLISLMEEKDRKIHLLEFKIEQLMKDTKTIVEDQSRLQVENTTLLKALSMLDKKQQQDTKGEEKWLPDPRLSIWRPVPVLLVSTSIV